MKKILLFLISVILVSCADNKTFEDKNGEFVAEPYGWFNKENKIEHVNYKLSTSNLVLSVIFCETIIVPIVLTGSELYEPISFTPPIIDTIKNE